LAAVSACTIGRDVDRMATSFEAVAEPTSQAMTDIAASTKAIRGWLAPAEEPTVGEEATPVDNGSPWWVHLGAGGGFVGTILVGLRYFTSVKFDAGKIARGLGGGLAGFFKGLGKGIASVKKENGKP
jgi:hypothetical protein